MSIDVISQVCVFNDYPMFRQLLTKYRSKFNKVILYPSRHHGVIDVEKFLEKELPETWVTGHTIDWTTPGIDWRQAETEPCLALSDSEWILFMEQDFFVTDWDKLWTKVEEAMKTAELVGWWNETAFPYVHPCFLLIKRSVLDKTRKDFRAHPEIPGCDHFAMITHDAVENGVNASNGKLVSLLQLGFVDWVNAFHMGGLTYPYQNWKGDGTDLFGVQNVYAFYAYNRLSREVPVAQALAYRTLSVEIEKELDKRGYSYDKRWDKFFK